VTNLICIHDLLIGRNGGAGSLVSGDTDGTLLFWKFELANEVLNWKQVACDKVRSVDFLFPCTISRDQDSPIVTTIHPGPGLQQFLMVESACFSGTQGTYHWACFNQGR
jgi:hypothetical protein